MQPEALFQSAGCARGMTTNSIATYGRTYGVSGSTQIEAACRFAARVAGAAPLLNLANRSIGSPLGRATSLVGNRATRTLRDPTTRQSARTAMARLARGLAAKRLF